MASGDEYYEPQASQEDVDGEPQGRGRRRSSRSARSTQKFRDESPPSSDCPPPVPPPVRPRQVEGEYDKQRRLIRSMPELASILDFLHVSF